MPGLFPKAGSKNSKMIRAWLGKNTEYSAKKSVVSFKMPEMEKKDTLSVSRAEQRMVVSKISQNTA